MSISRLTALSVILLTLCVTEASGQYWHGASGRVPLKIDSSRVLVKFTPGLSEADVTSLLSTIQGVGNQQPDNRVLDGFRAYLIESPSALGNSISELRAAEGVYLVEPYYLDAQDSAFVIGETFIVGFDSSLSVKDIEGIAEDFGIGLDRELSGMHNVFVLRNTARSERGLLAVANALHEHQFTRWSHPNFRLRLKQHVYKVWDDYYPFQNHIKKVIGRINEASVWDFAGLADADDSIVVAVIDDGVTVHEDLPASRILPSCDFCSGDSSAMIDDDPSPGSSSAHGMACAGIIAASHATDSTYAYHHRDGVISMNPLVRVLPVKIFPDEDSLTHLTVDGFADALNYAWQNGAQVMSNSWGFGDPQASVPSVNEALLYAVTYGRGGKGCPVFFASGNAGEMNYPVGYPAHLPYVMAVGSIDTLDVILGYTQGGDSLDLVAPSGARSLRGDVWTIDQMGDLGVNPNYGQYDPKYPWPWDCESWPGGNYNAYNCRMGGTSAACPVVAGAASLLLARDPDMLARDTTSDSSSDYNVYDVLCYSAVPLGGDVPNSTYGYGRVDAYRAILSIARGDANNSGTVSVGDISYLIDYLYEQTVPPLWPDSLLGDVNCTGNITIGDISILIDHLFLSEAPLPLPCFEFNV